MIVEPTRRVPAHHGFFTFLNRIFTDFSRPAPSLPVAAAVARQQSGTRPVVTVDVVGVKSLGQRLKASVHDLERARLVDRFGGLGLTKISELVPRHPVRVGGEIHRVVIAPRHGVPTLEVVVADGTGSITAVFTGRRAIIGIEHGRAVILEGVAIPESDRNVILNPAYTLIAPAHPH